MHSTEVTPDNWTAYYNAQFERWIDQCEDERRESPSRILASSTPVIMGGTK
jgi:hypothetical protein